MQNALPSTSIFPLSYATQVKEFHEQSKKDAEPRPGGLSNGLFASVDVLSSVGVCCELRSLEGTEINGEAMEEMLTRQAGTVDAGLGISRKFVGYGKAFQNTETVSLGFFGFRYDFLFLSFT